VRLAPAPDARSGAAAALFEISVSLSQQDGQDAILDAEIYDQLALHLRPNFPDAQILMAAIFEHFGRIDALVNNAQSSTPGVSLEAVTDENWCETLESGLYGTFHFMQAAWPHMKQQRSGRIINFASRTGIEGTQGFGPYAAAKEGIRGLSRVAAREWGPYGVTVNVVCPAALTPAADAYLDANPSERTRYLSEIPLGRFGDPQKDIGRVVAFLCSESAGYVTGQTINVDGGQTML